MKVLHLKSRFILLCFHILLHKILNALASSEKDSVTYKKTIFPKTERVNVPPKKAPLILICLSFPRRCLCFDAMLQKLVTSEQNSATLRRLLWLVESFPMLLLLSCSSITENLASQSECQNLVMLCSHVITFSVVMSTHTPHRKQNQI